MGLFGSRKTTLAPSEIRVPEHIANRVHRLPTPDLTQWADQALYTTGRYLSKYQRDPDPANLAEALQGAQALLAIVEEIKQRDDL